MTAMEETKAALKNRVQDKEIKKSSQLSLTQIITAEAMKKQFEMALPVNLKNNAERYIRCYLSQIRTNPKLAACNMQSVLGAMMTEAALGLDPTPAFGHAYIIPFKDEAQFIIGYKGMIELAYRAGIKKITAHEVYENDTFAIVYGLEESLIHQPRLNGDRGEIIGYYATATLPSGEKTFSYITKREATIHKNRFSLSKNGPWVEHFDEMAKKTAIRKLFKYTPKATEFNMALLKDEGVIKINSDATITQAQDVLDLPTEYPENEEEVQILEPQN